MKFFVGSTSLDRHLDKNNRFLIGRMVTVTDRNFYRTFFLNFPGYIFKTDLLKSRHSGRFYREKNIVKPIASSLRSERKNKKYDFTVNVLTVPPPTTGGYLRVFNITVYIEQLLPCPHLTRLLHHSNPLPYDRSGSSIRIVSVSNPCLHEGLTDYYVCGRRGKSPSALTAAAPK